MPERIPQSVAIRVPLKAYLSDGITDATGKTIAITISKNGGAFGNPSAGATNATEIASGWYYVDLSTTDTGTLGPLIVRGTATGVDNSEAIYNVVNAFNAGFTGIPGVVAEGAGGLYTRGTGAGQINQDGNGRIDTNTVNWKGSTAPAMTGDAFARLGAPAGASVSIDIAGIKSDTGSIPTAVQNADALLKRDMSLVTGEAARSPLNALRKLMNKVSLLAGVLSIFKEDDTAVAYTQAVVTDSAQQPIKSLDTV